MAWAHCVFACRWSSQVAPTTPGLLEPNFWDSQSLVLTFLGPTNFDQSFVSTAKMLSSKMFQTNNFLKPKFFGTQNFLALKLLLDQIVFLTHNCFYLTKIWNCDHIIFPDKSFGPNTFFASHFFAPKICCTQIYFGPSKMFFPKFFLSKILLTKFYFDPENFVLKICGSSFLYLF